jgi:hypothetical protein
MLKTLACALVILSPAAPLRAAPPSARPAREAPAQEGVDALLARGRALLEDGKAGEAQTLFEQAQALDKGSLRTRTWVLRAWIAQGRVNDALDQIDALDKAGQKGPAVDYLYGMAFAQKARGYITEGVSGGIIAMAFTDAVDYLKRATTADPELYRDAFLPLAECAWYAQQLELALAAAQQAAALRPKDPAPALVLGKVAFSQFVALQGDEARKAEADKAWTAAHDAFAKADELLAPAAAPEARAQRVEALQQLGWLAVWRSQGDEAARRFAAAIALDPAALDYPRLRASLAPEAFVGALEQGQKAYEQAFGADTSGDAGCLWWLGFGRYVLKRYDEAEPAFALALKKQPQFVNSWYYVALSRYFRQDYDGTIAALRAHWGASQDDCVASIRSNQDENLRILDYLIGIKASKARNLDAAFLSELQAAVVPANDRYWNNLGLFLRDEGEGRERSKRKLTAEERKEVQDLYERSYAAYLKSLELAPDDPNYLNDAALMLHYHLDRDLDKARAWYAKAAEKAKAELERKELTAEVRDLRQIALRDATNNLKLLDDLLEKRRKAEEERKQKQAGGSGG